MIFIGYTHKPGRVDYESIEEYKKRNDVERTVVFCREAPSKDLSDLFRDYDIRVSDNPRRSAKELAKDLKRSGFKVVVVDLQDFGERALRDTC